MICDLTARKSQCKSIIFSRDQNWKQRLKNKDYSCKKPLPQITCTQDINTQSIKLKYLDVQANSPNLLSKDKHSLFIPNIIILILTPSTPTFLSLHLQPTPILHSKKCLLIPLTHCNVVSSIAMWDYECWTVPICMELKVCPTDARKLRQTAVPIYRKWN